MQAAQGMQCSIVVYGITMYGNGKKSVNPNILNVAMTRAIDLFIALLPSIVLFGIMKNHEIILKKWYFFFPDYFYIRSLSHAIFISTWLHFGSTNRPKSRLGGVLGRLGRVLGASWVVLGRLGRVLERLGLILEHHGGVLVRLQRGSKRFGRVLAKIMLRGVQGRSSGGPRESP